VYYTNRIKDINRLSTDLTSSMILYCNMANNFDEMSQIVESLNVLRDYLINAKNPHQAQLMRGNHKVKDYFKYLGKEYSKEGTVPMETSNLVSKLDKIISMQVYGQYSKDAGTVKLFGKEISVTKGLGFIGTMTTLNGMFLNGLAGAANVMNNKIQIRLEAWAGEFFNFKNLLWAEGTYTKYTLPNAMEIGKREKQNKMALFMEVFNIGQDFETRIREFELHRKTKLGRAISTDTGFLFNNMGEHYSHLIIGLSLANAYKMKDPNGKETDLWEALEVKELKGNKDSKEGSGKVYTLVVKEGYTKLDGSKFTDDDIIKFTMKNGAIYGRLNGYYTKDDMTAFQATAIGKLVFMFKKHVIPMMQRRLQKSHYDYILDTVTEGFYRTF
jgi:hypothetical protein